MKARACYVPETISKKYKKKNTQGRLIIDSARLFFVFIYFFIFICHTDVAPRVLAPRWSWDDDVRTSPPFTAARVSPPFTGARVFKSFFKSFLYFFSLMMWWWRDDDVMISSHDVMTSPPCTGARVFNVAGDRARGRQSSASVPANPANPAVAYASYHGTALATH